MTALTRRAAMLGATAAAAAVATVPATVRAVADDAVLLARIEQFHDLYGELQDVWGKQQAHRATWEQCNRLNEQTGALAKAIFGTSARTFGGAFEKLKIAYMAIGDGETTDTGDDDLVAFQDLEAPWMEDVIADFERLSGGLRS